MKSKVILFLTLSIGIYHLPAMAITLSQEQQIFTQNQQTQAQAFQAQQQNFQNFQSYVTAHQQAFENSLMQSNQQPAPSFQQVQTPAYIPPSNQFNFQQNEYIPNSRNSGNNTVPDEIPRSYGDINPQKPTVIPSGDRDDSQSSDDATDNKIPSSDTPEKTVRAQDRYALDGVLVSSSSSASQAQAQSSDGVLVSH